MKAIFFLCSTTAAFASLRPPPPLRARPRMRRAAVAINENLDDIPPAELRGQVYINPHNLILSNFMGKGREFLYFEAGFNCWSGTLKGDELTRDKEACANQI